MRLGELTHILWLVLFFSFVVGCTIGSFLNVVVWRVPRGESLVSPPSHCPNCNHQIRAWENIPVLSWLFLRGRCSGCHLPISIRYPLGELATGALYAVVAYFAWRRNMPLAVLPGYFFALGAMISVTQIDIKHGIIPDLVTYSGMVVGVLLSLLLPSSRLIFGSDLTASENGNILFGYLVRHLSLGLGADVLSMPMVAAFLDCVLGLLMGLLILGCVSFPVWLLNRMSCKHRMPLPIGWGDVKYLGMLGCFLGADSCWYVVCGASVAGFAYGIIRLIAKSNLKDHRVCFGPFLSVAALIWMSFGRWW